MRATSELARWLRGEMDRRGLGQNQATISDVLTKGYVPKVETLFKLADGLETSPVAVFLQVPARWRLVVVEFVRLWVRFGGMRG